MATLKNWSLTSGKYDPYKPPELCKSCLQGNAYGHDNHVDGTHVITSPIVSAKDGIVITISGTQYLLSADEVDLRYEKCYPKAFERLFANG